MKTTIQGRNLQLDDAIRDYIAQKLSRVERHVSSARSVAVHLSHEMTRREDQRFAAQITLDVNGSVIRSEERAGSARGAIDAAAHAIDRRVGRLKSRLYRSERARQSGSSIRFDQPEAAEAPEVEEEDGRVVRVKRFPIKPMTVEEAIFQMDMLGHDFFLFLTTDSRQYNVLYKRRDGDYGLIVPEML